MFSRNAAAHRVAQRIAVLSVALTLSLATAHGASAQEPLRQGFNFSVGAGQASVSADCASCTNNFLDDRIKGFSGVMRIGGAVTPKLVIGAEGMGWIKNSDGLDRRIAAASVVMLGYPSATSGFFVKSGIGFMRAIAEDSFVTLQSDAIVSQIGVGLDIHTGSGVSLTAYANYLRTFGTSTWANGVLSPEAVNPNALQFGTALTIH